MTFLRKDRIIITHNCKKPEKELQNLQKALAFAKPYMDNTEKNLRIYKQLVKALEAAHIQKERNREEFIVLHQL